MIDTYISWKTQPRLICQYFTFSTCHHQLLLKITYSALTHKKIDALAVTLFVHCIRQSVNYEKPLRIRQFNSTESCEHFSKWKPNTTHFTIKARITLNRNCYQYPNASKRSSIYYRDSVVRQVLEILAKQANLCTNMTN